MNRIRINPEAFTVQMDKMINLIEQFLPLEQWNFRENCRFASQGIYPTIIFNSEFCRIRFMWDEGSPSHMDPQMLHIHYGRLHAPNNEEELDWMITTKDGEKCYCWRRVNEALLFLDGLSPKEAVDQLRVHGKWPSRMEQFRQSEIGEGLAHNQPEWIIRMHGDIWKQYGKRLFELFDLRRSDLWEEFRQFLKEFYEIKGIIPNMNPLQSQTC